MDQVYSRAILFSLAVCWGYIGALLAHEDLRWHRRRIAFCALMAVPPAFCLVRGFLEAEVVLGLMLVLLVFGVLPTVLERRLLRGIASEGAADGRLMFLYRLVAWDRTPRALRALAEAASEAEIGLSDHALRRLEETFGGTCGPRVLSRSLIQVLYRLVRWDQWADAVDLFERFFPDPSKSEPDVLFVMVRAYAEVGRADRACACLEAAEAKGPLYRHQQMERLLAYVALFALTGRRDALDRFLRRKGRLLRELPEAFVPYWRAVAEVARGRAPAAERGFERAVDLRAARPEDHVWRAAAARRMDDSADLRERARGCPLRDEEVERLLALDTLAERTAAQRPAEANPFRARLGPVTAALIALNVIVWLVMGASTDEVVLVRFGANVPFFVRAGQYWRLISSMFLHIGFLHLLFNCAACYVVGSFVERRSGHRGMFILYMLSGLAGSAASAFLGRHQASAGASGAIMGLFGAGMVLIVRQRWSLPRPARTAYPVLLAMLVALTFAFDLMEEGIDHLAHLGGFFAGMLAGLLLPAGLPSSAEADADPPAAVQDLRRPRHYLTNALVGLMLVVFAYGGVMATANVLSGGYPSVAPDMVEWVSPTHPVAVFAPAFWRVIPAQRGEALVLHDPLGASLAVRLAPLPGGPSLPLPGRDVSEGWIAAAVEALARRYGAAWMRFEVGGRVFYQFTALADDVGDAGAAEASGAVDSEGRAARTIEALLERARERWISPRSPSILLRDVYVTDLGGMACFLEFSCLEGRHPMYLALFRRIVGSVRPVVPEGESPEPLAGR